MKKYVKDMSCDELRNVWNNNEKLRREVWESALKYVDSCNVGEYLYRLDRRAASYDIGYCGQWMNVKNPALFLEWVERSNSDFDIFWPIESENPGMVDALCERGQEIAYRLENYDLSDKNAEMMENRLDEICDLFRCRFLELCREEYDWIDNDKNLFEFWEEEFTLMNYFDCYIDDSDGKTHWILRRVQVIETVFA